SPSPVRSVTDPSPAWRRARPFDGYLSSAARGDFAERAQDPGFRAGLRQDQIAVFGGDLDRVAVAEAAFEDGGGDRVAELLLQDPLQRPRPVDGVVAALGEQVESFGADLEVDAPAFEAVSKRGHLDLHDLTKILPTQLVEDDDVVDAVEELGSELVADRTH